MTFRPTLPPIRQLIRPDPGWCLLDIDLERADVHICAWEAGAEKLKAILRSRVDFHSANAKMMNCTRQQAKNGIHAVDYYVREKTLSFTLGVSVEEARSFISKYFSINPEIREWHNKTRHALRLKRQVRNVFGFRRFYFDRMRPGNNDDIDRILPQALAWQGSSPVSVIINRGIKNLDCARQLVGQRRCGRCLECEAPGTVQVLLQVHDSALVQVPIALCPRIFPEILERMKVEVPYEDPLVIPLSMKYSSQSWGKAVAWSPGEEFKEAA